jgi:hypothetical protein
LTDVITEMESTNIDEKDKCKNLKVHPLKLLKYIRITLGKPLGLLANSSSKK